MPEVTLNQLIPGHFASMQLQEAKGPKKCPKNHNLAAKGLNDCTVTLSQGGLTGGDYHPISY